MSWVRVAAARLRGLFERKRLERELEDEVRFHLEMQMEDNLKAGMSPAEARYAALRSFGAVEAMKEIYRERRTVAVIETTVQDLRYAWRTLGRNPGFTATTVSVLALAIGVNTAMFAVLNAVLFRPLPYRSPEQLVMLWTEDPARNLREGRTAYWNVEQWRSQCRSFSAVAFFDSASATLTTADRAEKVSVLRASPDLFPLLGIQPLYGRVFTAEEAEQRQRVALISHRFWQSHFGGSLDAIGASIQLDGASSRIVGILPPDYLFGNEDVWEPYTMHPDWESVRRARGAGFWAVMGRLRRNVTVQQAQAEMNAIARRLDVQLPLAQRNRDIRVVPLSHHVIGPQQRRALWMLAGAIFLVFLTAAINVAGLSLARSVTRAREIAIRAALGASRTRIVRQLVAESLTLAVLAGLLGMLVAHAGIRLIVAVKPGNLARLNEVGLDLPTLGCAVAFCLLTGFLIGLTPAVTMARQDPGAAGREGGRGIAGGAATLRTRRVLVAAEFALATILLTGAGLLVRSLLSVQSVNLGFRPERVLSVSLAPPASLAPAQRAAFYTTVLKEVESIPGVESTGITSELFLSSSSTQIVIPEGDTQRVFERRQFRSDEVSTRLFNTIGTPLLRGRFFSDSDGPNSPPVAIINESMAQQMWPGRDPVGKRFKVGSVDPANPWFTVVGVVGDMRRQGLEQEPIPQMFQPIAQNPPRRAILLVRTSAADPLSIAGAVQAAVRRVDKHAPVYGVNTLENQLDVFLAERRFQTWLLIGFAVAAMLIAAIGIYGLIRYSIAMRTHEIGIRMAVGAQSGAIFRMIVGEGMKLSLTGLVLGLVGALWLGHAGSSLLFGVTPTDPLTLITVSLSLTAVGVAACCFPARRAMKVEPIVALRHE
ncbi:MAG: ABC transporter permease [Bryobacteraceae bacterium]|nr:ABC transporter permease [Bryobacteraceae bacterium]